MRAGPAGVMPTSVGLNSMRSCSTRAEWNAMKLGAFVAGGATTTTVRVVESMIAPSLRKTGCGCAAAGVPSATSTTSAANNRRGRTTV